MNRCDPYFQKKRADQLATDLLFGQSLWSGRGDLNSGPPEPHSGALPGCATSRKNAIIMLPLCFVKE